MDRPPFSRGIDLIINFEKWPMWDLSVDSYSADEGEGEGTPAVLPLLLPLAIAEHDLVLDQP